MKLTPWAALLFCLSAIVVLPQSSLAQSAAPQRVAATLREVTVYRSVAELRQSAERALPAGTSEVRLTGLAPNLLSAGLQVEVTGAELLTSALVRVYPKKTASDSLLIAEKTLYRLQAEQEAVAHEKEFLVSNRQLPTDSKLNWTVERQKGAAYYRTRIFDLALRRDALSREIDEQQQRIAWFKQRDLTAVANGLEIVVRVQAATAATVRFGLRYLVPGSRWQPRHDVRMREPGQALQVVNRALVRNESGIDWNGVRVTLLSADPSVGALRPALQPWTLRYSGEALNEGRLDGFATKAPAPATAPGVYSADDRSKSAYRVPVIDADESDGPDDFSERFGVAEGVSVPTGSAQLVQLGTAEAPATLEYLTVPKLDPSVFLLAKVTGWEVLKLLADSANVYLRGAYLGQTFLNTRAFGDTLELALGRDPLVQVSRTKREDYNSKGGMGRRTVRLSYEINIKNLHKTPVNLRVLDQVPVPQEEDIKVEYTPAKGVVLDQESGRLTWQFTLAPNDNRKLPFSFEINYPKNKQVNLHRNRNTRSPKFR